MFHYCVGTENDRGVLSAGCGHFPLRHNSKQILLFSITVALIIYSRYAGVKLRFLNKVRNCTNFKHWHFGFLRKYEPRNQPFRAQWSLYVPHSGHYMYRTVVTICTASFAFNNSTSFPHSVFMCFVWIWEQTVIISLYSIDWLVFITETECVHCAVRSAHTLYLCVLCGSENKQRLFHCTALTGWLIFRRVRKLRKNDY